MPRDETKLLFTEANAEEIRASEPSDLMVLFEHFIWGKKKKLRCDYFYRKKM